MENEKWGDVMKCLQCGGKTGVTDSRPSIEGTEVIRVRRCKSCGNVFMTFEWVDDSEDLEEEYREVKRKLRQESQLRSRKCTYT